MRGERRFSQAISEGDGISLLAEVTGADAARAAESGGAEGIVVRGDIAGLRGATELPVLSFGAATDSEADAWVVEVEGLEAEDGRLERTYGEALEAGLDCVVAVLDEDQLQLALERLDPEILLLRGAGLEQVLGLLPDVPAGKLAIAELAVAGPAEIEELERAGVDAVIVPAATVGRLVGEP
ncbi:MAG: hypothetical protein WD689_01710 [Gaiellaceae bacterium]